MPILEKKKNSSYRGNKKSKLNPTTQATKEKTRSAGRQVLYHERRLGNPNKLNTIKIKNFYSSKHSIKKAKR